jgi:hypothetical protein
MKDSFWFKHDSTAGRDIKLRKIQHIYGHEGKGLFWDVVEVLREEGNYTHPSDENSLQMLCDLIGYKDVPRFINWFNDCVKVELFMVKNGHFFSKSLMIRMKVWESKKENGNKPKKKRIKSENEANQREEKRREYINKKIEDAWLRWIEFKKSQFKFEYATIESEQQAINALVKLCNGDFDLADRIVTNSIVNGYKGLFPLKDEKTVVGERKMKVFDIDTPIR